MVENEDSSSMHQGGILRDSRIVFRMTGDEYETVRRRAAACGMTLSSYVRVRILNETSDLSCAKKGRGAEVLSAASLKEIRRNFNESAKSISRLAASYESSLSKAGEGGGRRPGDEAVLRILTSVVSNEMQMQDSLNRLLRMMDETETFIASRPSSETTVGAAIREMLSERGGYAREVRTIDDKSKRHIDMVKATVFGYLSGDPVLETGLDGTERLRFEVDFSGTRKEDVQLIGKVTVMTDKVKLKDSLKRGKLVFAEGPEVIQFGDGGVSIYIMADTVSVHGVLSGRMEGNLVTDASPFTSKSGLERVRFRIAAEGDTIDGGKKTQFISVVMHRDETTLEHLKKGARVYVECVEDVGVSSSSSGSFLNISVYADTVSVVKAAKSSEE